MSDVPPDADNEAGPGSDDGLSPPEHEFSPPASSTASPGKPPTSSNHLGGELRKKRGKLKRLTEQQSELLTRLYDETSGYPSTEHKQELSALLDMPLISVTKWFINRRSRLTSVEARNKRKPSDPDAPAFSKSSKKSKRHRRDKHSSASSSSRHRTQQFENNGVVPSISSNSLDASSPPVMEFGGPASGFDFGLDTIDGGGAAGLSPIEEGDLEFWSAWVGEHKEQVEAAPYDAEAEDFFDTVAWRTNMFRLKRSSGGVAPPISKVVEDDDDAGSEVTGPIPEIPEISETARLRAMPAWKQIYLATQPLVSALYGRANAVLQQALLERIAHTRALSGLPPVFAVLSSSTLSPSVFVMESEGITLGRNLESDGHDPDRLGIGHAPELIKNHAVLCLDREKRAFVLTNLSSVATKIYNIAQPASLAEDALFAEALSAGTYDNSVPGSASLGPSSAFKLHLQLELTPGAWCALPNPCVIEFPGSVVCFQMFSAMSQAKLPTSVTLLNQLRSVQGFGDAPSTIDREVNIAQADTSSAPASVSRRPAHDVISYVEMATHAVLAHGNRASLREILAYVGVRFSKALAEVRSWKRSLASVIAQSPWFAPNLPYDNQEERGHGRTWSLQSPDLARASLVEELVLDGLVDPALAEASRALLLDATAQKQGSLQEVPRAPVPLLNYPDPSSNADAALTALMTMPYWSVVRDVADEIERRWPRWVEQKTRNWRVSSVPGTLREGANFLWDRRMPNNNKNEYRTYGRSLISSKRRPTYEGPGVASRYACDRGTAYELATSESDVDLVEEPNILPIVESAVLAPPTDIF